MTKSASVRCAETVLEVPGPQGPLQGTMLLPDQSGAPVALIIPGSGPTDRDGNGPRGLSSNTYRLLAEGLAQRGIGSVRIDKRGMYGSTAAVPDANAVVFDDYAADVHTWIGVIRRKTGANCIWLLGHSEGGAVALHAAEDEKGICGLVLVSTAGRVLGDVLREQLRSSPEFASLLPKAFSAITLLEAGKAVNVAGMNPSLLSLFATELQGFIMNSFAQDPTKMIAGIEKPILVLQGQRDIQVTAEDARRLGEANPGAKIVVLPDTNHVLKFVGSEDRAANLATYSNPSLPLAPGIVEIISDFIMPPRDPASPCPG